MRHVVMRFVPRFDRRWLVAILVVGLVVLAATFVRWGDPIVEMELVALGPDGQFHQQMELPADWGDTETTTTDAVVRFPLILAVHNTGYAEGRPDRIVLRLPARFRLTGAGGEELPVVADPATPLLTYRLDPRLETVEPGRLPALLPAHETLWLEAVIPRYYCVTLAGAIPEFVPASPPALGPMSDLRVFYALEGGTLPVRQTGVLSFRLDTTRMAVAMPEQPPTFTMITDAAAARPAMGPLRLVGSREVRCGEPEAPMELLSTVWETEGGARMIALDYEGVVRKHLFDLDGNGTIDRESWDPEGDGRFTATRRASLPTPEFLLPIRTTVAYDMDRFADVPPDSLARLDPFGRAMPGPGAVPLAAELRPEATMAPPGARPAATTPPIGTAPPGTAPAAQPAPAAADTAPAPAPRPQPAQPLGRPLPPDGGRR